jgi:hypothetical protein
MTPGEDFPALTKELDERAFLCKIQVYRDGGCFCRIYGMNPNFFGVLGCVKSLIWQGSTNIG